MAKSPRSPGLIIGYTPGVPGFVMSNGVEPLTPETFNPALATEETERAQAAANQQRFEVNMRKLVEQAGLIAYEEYEEGDN